MTPNARTIAYFRGLGWSIGTVEPAASRLAAACRAVQENKR